MPKPQIFELDLDYGANLQKFLPKWNNFPHVFSSHNRHFNGKGLSFRNYSNEPEAWKVRISKLFKIIDTLALSKNY